MRCEGVTSRSMSFPATASFTSEVTHRLSGKRKPGRNIVFSRRCCISTARSGRCSHIVVSVPLLASKRASVVPQAPLPITPVDVIESSPMCLLRGFVCDKTFLHAQEYSLLVCDALWAAYNILSIHG